MRLGARVCVCVVCACVLFFVFRFDSFLVSLNPTDHLPTFAAHPELAATNAAATATTTAAHVHLISRALSASRQCCLLAVPLSTHAPSCLTHLEASGFRPANPLAKPVRHLHNPRQSADFSSGCCALRGLASRLAAPAALFGRFLCLREGEQRKPEPS